MTARVTGASAVAGLRVLYGETVLGLDIPTLTGQLDEADGILWTPGTRPDWASLAAGSKTRIGRPVILRRGAAPEASASLSIVSDDSQTVAHGKPNPHLSVEEVNGRQFFYSFPNTPSTRTTPLPQASGSRSGSGTPTEYDDNDTASLASNPDPNVDADADEIPVGRRKRTEPSTSAFQARMRRGRHRAQRL